MGSTSSSSGGLEDLRRDLIVLEATGGFERPAAAALVAARHN
jgi:hypothetical protein